MAPNRKSVLSIMGPTASGKSDIALQLAEHFPIEIISVDSALIYRGMDIGTAKPTTEMRAQVPHHLIDICDPRESYSVARFCNDVTETVQSVFAREKIPVLVGGTMMYFRALLSGLSDMPSTDPVLRQSLEGTLKLEGIGALYERLRVLDPVSAERLKPTDTQRILRALEVVIQTEKPMHHYWVGEKWQFPYALDCISIMPASREILHERIKHRALKMIEMGLIDEVATLKNRGDLNIDMPSMRSVGYRQTWEYLEGLFTKSELTEKITIATRQLAKRQITWLKAWPNLNWVEPECAFCVLQTYFSQGGISK